MGKGTLEATERLRRAAEMTKSGAKRLVYRFGR